MDHRPGISRQRSPDLGGHRPRDDSRALPPATDASRHPQPTGPAAAEGRAGIALSRRIPVWRRCWPTNAVWRAYSSSPPQAANSSTARTRRNPNSSSTVRSGGNPARPCSRARARPASWSPTDAKPRTPTHRNRTSFHRRTQTSAHRQEREQRHDRMAEASIGLDRSRRFAGCVNLKAVCATPSCDTRTPGGGIGPLDRTPVPGAGKRRVGRDGRDGCGRPVPAPLPEPPADRVCTTRHP